MRPLAFLLVLLTVGAGLQATELDGHPGTLVFANGDRVTGQLVAEGVFRSARFGEVKFTREEARFEPTERTAGDDTSGGLRARIEELITGRPRTASALQDTAEETAQKAAAPPPSTPPAPAPPAKTIAQGKQPGPGTASQPLDRPWWHPWKLTISGYPFFTDSKLSHGVQLADLCAYNVYRAFQRPQLDYPYFQNLIPAIYYSRRTPPEKLDGLKVWPETSSLVSAAAEMWRSNLANKKPAAGSSGLEK